MENTKKEYSICNSCGGRFVHESFMVDDGHGDVDWDFNDYCENPDCSSKLKKTKHSFQAGDEVYYKEDLAKEKYIVYGLYGGRRISLALLEYPDVEQDYTIDFTQVNKFIKKEIKK